eukprot:gnl/TRDRNA2_/TRDRNA2_91391_c0_seq1.p2 gnl/TRDRNA2_/TRDRNA2_91391_c0~~gnl/TRDRNA2_/TRDRNA2_91391_c0_seq1.p2  ORF type:complete len:146 (+),score=31.79 gnl/TRDRNA2_/TRDRNA2_91391_c0_seq1:338-775(+)
MASSGSQETPTIEELQNKVQHLNEQNVRLRRENTEKSHTIEELQKTCMFNQELIEQWKRTVGDQFVRWREFKRAVSLDEFAAPDEVRSMMLGMLKSLESCDDQIMSLRETLAKQHGKTEKIKNIKKFAREFAAVVDSSFNATMDR